MRLTAAGQVLSRQTQRMFRDLDRVRAAIDDLRGIRRGQVSVYGPEGLVAEFLPRVLSEFQAKYPAISCQVFFGSTDRIVEAVVDDETDIGITFNGPKRPDLATVAEFVEPLKCLVGPEHALADETEVSLQQVLAFPLALPEASFGMRRMIDEAISGEKLTPHISINTNSLEFAKRMAMTGTAIAFMPGFMVQDDVAAGKLRSITVNTPVFLNSRVTVCIHRDRELSFASREFLRFLTRFFVDMGSSVQR